MHFTHAGCEAFQRRPGAIPTSARLRPRYRRRIDGYVQQQHLELNSHNLVSIACDFWWSLSSIGGTISPQLLSRSSQYSILFMDQILHQNTIPCLGPSSQNFKIRKKALVLCACTVVF